MVEIVLPRAVGSQGPAGPMGPGATDQQVASVVTPIVDAKTAGKAAKDGSNVEADAFRGAIGTFATRAAAMAHNFGAGNKPSAIRLDGYATAGDGGEALYKHVASQPAHTAKFQTADGQWWELAEPTVNVRMFGAVGDGVADDTAAIHAAFNFVLSKGGGRVHVPGGKYRVTSGFTHIVSYADVHLSGDTSSREDVGGSQGSIIILDNASAASFFFKVTTNLHLQVSSIAFKCAQYALDRAFFDLSGGLVAISMDNVNFESVEQPLVLRAGLAMQSGSLRNVQFRNSGTIHSKTSGGSASDIDTMMVFDDVNHEGSVPVNSEKVVCNLSGIRYIQGRAIILEGALPGPDWTILKLHDAFTVGWARGPLASISGYWSEWGGVHSPLVDVEQIGGRTLFQNAAFSTGKIRLSSAAVITVEDSSFGGTQNVGSKFECLDDYSHINITRCMTRNVDVQDDRITYHNINVARDGASEVLGSCYISPGRGAIAYRWDGGLPDTDRAPHDGGGGGLYVSADDDYGRKIVFRPTSTTSLAIELKVKMPGLKKGDQVYVAGLLRLPVATTGEIGCFARIGSSSVARVLAFNVLAGQVVPFVFATRVLSNPDIARVGALFSTVGVTEMTGNLEVLALEVGTGDVIPRQATPDYPYNISTVGTAIPTQGKWRRGDRISNKSSSIGSPAGWVCTADGTPGTWATLPPAGMARAAAQANTSASDVAGLAADFNALLVKLRAANILTA